MKRCPVCSLEKEKDKFWKNQYLCVLCQKEKQKGLCAICSDVLPDLMVYEKRSRGYAVDHNHETGKFRGILCLHCNTLLGMAKESTNILHKAAEYLKKEGSYPKPSEVKND